MRAMWNDSRLLYLGDLASITQWPCCGYSDPVHPCSCCSLFGRAQSSGLGSPHLSLTSLMMLPCGPAGKTMLLACSPDIQPEGVLNFSGWEWLLPSSLL